MTLAELIEHLKADRYNNEIRAEVLKRLQELDRIHRATNEDAPAPKAKAKAKAKKK